MPQEAAQWYMQGRHYVYHVAPLFGFQTPEFEKFSHQPKCHKLSEETYSDPFKADKTTLVCW